MEHLCYWIRRFYYFLFYRGGHGVHSPFVFDLITRVIEEDTPYYAFEQLEKRRRSRQIGYTLYTRGEAELIFRLICRYHIRHVFVSSERMREAISDYLQAANSHIEIEVFAGSALSSSLFEQVFASPVLFLVADSSDRITMPDGLPDGSLIYISGDFYAKRARQLPLWAMMRMAHNVPITIDLPRARLCVVSRKLNKRHYKAFL